MLMLYVGLCHQLIYLSSSALVRLCTLQCCDIMRCKVNVTVQQPRQALEDCDNGDNDLRAVCLVRAIADDF